MFAHALGTDQHIWDHVISLLPDGLRTLTFDLRGHGGSSVPDGPYSMGALVRDTERLMEFCEIRDSLFVGLSIGGMIAQGLAVKRLDQIRALVLSNTAAKIGTPDLWQRRMAAIRSGGMVALSKDTMQRWFPRAYVKSGAHAPTQAQFENCPPEGYLGCCAAVAGTDFYTPTSGLRLPALGIAGSEDGLDATGSGARDPRSDPRLAVHAVAPDRACAAHRPARTLCRTAYTFHAGDRSPWLIYFSYTDPATAPGAGATWSRP